MSVLASVAMTGCHVVDANINDAGDLYYHKDRRNHGVEYETLPQNSSRFGYPVPAESHIHGYGTTRGEVMLDHTLANCEKIDEKPTGFNFADSCLLIARVSRFSPAVRDGQLYVSKYTMKCAF